MAKKSQWPGILAQVTDRTKALAVICLVVDGLFLLSLPSLDTSHRIYAVASGGVILVVVAIGIVLIELAEARSQGSDRPAPTSQEPCDPSSLVHKGIDALMDSSNWPMFFTDLNRIVLRCNGQLGHLLDCTAADFEGKQVWPLIERLAEQVPAPRRDAFIQRQRDLQKKYDAKLHPHSDEFEYLDTTHHPASNLWRGKYKMWIHADRLRIEGQEVGYLVVYHLEKTDRIPQPTGDTD